MGIERRIPVYEANALPIRYSGGFMVCIIDRLINQFLIKQAYVRPLTFIIFKTVVSQLRLIKRKFIFFTKIVQFFK